MTSREAALASVPDDLNMSTLIARPSFPFRQPSTQQASHRINRYRLAKQINLYLVALSVLEHGERTSVSKTSTITLEI
jgi:hypothetical protein